MPAEFLQNSSKFPQNFFKMFTQYGINFTRNLYNFNLTLNPIIIVPGKNWHNKTTDMGKMSPKKRFFGFNSDDTFFLMEKLKSDIQNLIFHKKSYTSPHLPPPLTLAK